MHWVNTQCCQPGTEKSHGGLDGESRPMCGGRNPPNKNLSRLLQSALPDLPIIGALFLLPGFLVFQPTN